MPTTPAAPLRKGQPRLRWLLAAAAAARLPRRAHRRQSEPRAQYYKPQVFPKMKESRAEMRRALNKSKWPGVGNL